MVTERSIVTEQGATQAPVTAPAPGPEASQPAQGAPQSQSAPTPTSQLLPHRRPREEKRPLKRSSRFNLP